MLNCTQFQKVFLFRDHSKSILAAVYLSNGRRFDEKCNIFAKKYGLSLKVVITKIYSCQFAFVLDVQKTPEPGRQEGRGQEDDTSAGAANANEMAQSRLVLRPFSSKEPVLGKTPESPL